MRLITKTLDLPNTLNHDILRRHVDQPPNAGTAKLTKTIQRSATLSTTTPYTMQENDDEYQTKY